MADTLSQRATCHKLSVGCILTDVSGRILSAGYNGVASGREHCNEGNPCKGACEATHAESNAIISCHASRSQIHTCYTTWSPCLHCCKQLIQTGCVDIIYGSPSEELVAAETFWVKDHPIDRIYPRRSMRRWRS
jgi:dCMP deaminase